LHETQLRWFDYYLKGIDTGILEEAPVKVFVMGENVWRDEQEWPLTRTRYTPYYLRSQGQANSLNGDGRLELAAPAEEPPDRFVYDPDDPVPTCGGNTLIIPMGGARPAPGGVTPGCVGLYERRGSRAPGGDRPHSRETVCIQ